MILFFSSLTLLCTLRMISPGFKQKQLDALSFHSCIMDLLLRGEWRAGLTICTVLKMFSYILMQSLFYLHI